MCGLRKFDRRKESANKLKFRSNTSSFTGSLGKANANGIGKAKLYSTNTSMAGSIPMLKDNEVYI